MSLESRVEGLANRTTSSKGMVYRSASPKYASSRDILTGEGSRRFGGRWNPAGIAAVYGSWTPQTAMEETFAHSRYFSLPLHASMPRTFVAIEFKLSAVLDLTAGEIRKSLRVSAKRMFECDWRQEIRTGRVPITQAIGQAVFDTGIEAFLVGSAADPEGVNLVVFVANMRKSSSLSVLSAEKLTKP